MELVSQLTTLESSGLISVAQVQPELEYLFRHTLVQEAAYDSLLRTDRRQLHRVVGETLERLYPERLEELAPLLAEHFNRADEAQKAFHYFTQAGDAAFRSYANSEAIAHYTCALELADKGNANREEILRLYLHRGRALELNADYKKALDNYETMLQMALAHGDQPMVLAAMMASATIYATPNTMHDTDRAYLLCDQALELAVKIGDRTAEARIYWNRMILFSKDGLYIPAIENGEHAIALARELNLIDLLPYALNDISQAYIETGQLKEGNAVLLEARDRWRASRNLPMLADSLSTSTLYDFFIGNYDQAIEDAEEARQISQIIGNAWGQAYSQMFVNYVYQERGDFGKAIQSMEEPLRLSEQAGFIAPQMSTQADLGLAYARVGQVEKGLAICKRAQELATELRVPTWGIYADGVLAQIYCLSRDYEEAHEYIHKAEQMLRGSHPHNLFQALMLSARAQVAYAEKDIPGLIELVDKLGFLREIGMAPFVYEILYYKGLGLSAIGQDDEAEVLLLEALSLAEPLQARRVLWSIYFALSELMAKRGDRTAGKRFLQQAKDMLNYITANIGLDDLLKSFLSLPQVRQVIDAGID